MCRGCRGIKCRLHAGHSLASSLEGPSRSSTTSRGAVDEELVPVGSLDPDHIHTPGIFVNRIFKGSHEKRIENRTISER